MLQRTQSGRGVGVKRYERRTRWPGTWSVAAIVIVMTAACAPSVGGWRSPVKNEASTRADYADCRARAEAATLTQRQTERTGYGLESSNQSAVFNPRGDNTMAIAERSDTSTLYDKLVASCMTGRGYRQPTAP